MNVMAIHMTMIGQVPFPWSVLMLADVIVPTTKEPRARLTCCQEI